MRIRATVAAVTGALALSALVAPAAQADAQGTASVDKPSAAERFGASSTKSTFGGSVTAEALPVVSKVTVNSGKDLVLGTTAVKTFTVSLTASHATGVEDAYIDLWHGTDVESDIDGLLLPNEDAATCTASSATTSTCKLTITATPGIYGDLYKNALAGTWHVTAAVLAGDGSVYGNDFYKTHKVKRAAKVTVNAAPEPVKKGKTITVTGKLSRANWETGVYAGYSTQKVVLQFRKKSATTYTNVKGITTSTTGALKTTTTAKVDGYYRFTFAGTGTTGTATAAGDYVDVK
ncbi:calcium-binding protein [Streptomyces sp. V4I2]|uniref:calcium-binding protein n=1 Tax=Streptomyces sp. V4I2 TaxID=3042280 RepID=UPI002785FC53|nr:calcium-binding protein [Streptomyces sp. V4I2]MDQ1046537.1 putative membrane protein [Streptomyces sp. V4I2]